MSRLRYMGAAFMARPFGMPVPPNWFGLAALGLLGALVNPGFYLIGAGLELAYLWLLSGHPRFRAVVDATANGGERSPADAEWERKRKALMDGLPRYDQSTQSQLEQRCGEILDTLRDRAGAATHAEGLSSLAWLHLRLLAARVSLRQLAGQGASDAGELGSQEARAHERLAQPDLDPDLKRTLEQQVEVIRARRAAHAEGAKRLARVEAELERIQQQVALVRDQALLATDDDAVARSVDSLAASLNEASRWLQDEPDLLAGLDLAPAPPPEGFLARGRRTDRPRSRTGETT